MRSRIKSFFQKYAVILFFGLFFLYGMAVVGDYGISWDEATERNSSLINFGYVLPRAKEIVTDTVNYNGLPELSEYKDRYYGVAGQIPTTIIEYLYHFQFNYQQVYLLRHIYTFTVFWAACICFFLLCRRFTRGKWMALLGTLMLILSPRILADSFYNIKDLLFLSFFVIALYFAMRLIERQTFGRLIVFAFLGGLCTNVRIVGAVTVLCCILILALKMLPDKQISLSKKLIFLLGTGILSLLFFLFFTPITWANPVSGIKGILETFSSYSSYDQTVFFLGENILSSELPWYYLPVWILSTTPVIILILLAVGAVVFGYRILTAFHRQKISAVFGSVLKGERNQEILFLFLNAFIPLFYVFLCRPVLYNGWRHFYFLWPLLALAALSPLIVLTAPQKNDRVWKSPVCTSADGHSVHSYYIAVRIFAAVGVSVGLLGVAGWMVQNHPFEYLYFNAIARPFAEANFEKDYWGVSQYDALQYICDHDSSDTIRVWVMTPSDNQYLLNYDDQSRIVITEDLYTADYVIYNHTSTRSTEALGPLSLYEPYYVKEVDDMAVYTIFRRVYTPWYCSALEASDDGEITVEARNISWSLQYNENQSIVLTGQLSAPVSTDRIRLESGDRSDFPCDPSEWTVCLSEDGENWIEVPLLYEENPDYDYDFHCNFNTMDLEYIRLIHTPSADTDENVFHAWNLEVQILTPRTAETDAHTDTIILSSTASHQPEEAAFAWDGSLETRWTSGIIQESGMYYQAELAVPLTANQLKLVQAGYRSDFPTALEISVSTDGREWDILPCSTEDNETFTFPETTFQYIRFQIPEGEWEAETNWSIYEILFSVTVQ